jgi:antiviral helicase SKI2
MGGIAACIHVLEIGTMSTKRHPTDILPFLPHMRPLFQPLPHNVADMSLRPNRIPLADLECVTNTQVKFSGPMWYLNIKKGKSTFNFFSLFLFHGINLIFSKNASSGQRWN